MTLGSCRWGARGVISLTPSSHWVGSCHGPGVMFGGSWGGPGFDPGIMLRVSWHDRRVMPMGSLVGPRLDPGIHTGGGLSWSCGYGVCVLGVCRCWCWQRAWGSFRWVLGRSWPHAGGDSWHDHHTIRVPVGSQGWPRLLTRGISAWPWSLASRFPGDALGHDSGLIRRPQAWCRVQPRTRPRSCQHDLGFMLRTPKHTSRVILRLPLDPASVTLVLCLDPHPPGTMYGSACTSTPGPCQSDPQVMPRSSPCTIWGFPQDLPSILPWSAQDPDSMIPGVMLRPCCCDVGVRLGTPSTLPTWHVMQTPSHGFRERVMFAAEILLFQQELAWLFQGCS